ncbi:unnamed protein product [Heterobilharzia americana]|nr:unnamed protein product [Heterobilharzia americana]CAH8469549.1 unnamed protein product [Heterobilharzia americana]
MTSRRSFYRAQELVEAVHLQSEITDRKPKLSGSQLCKPSASPQFASQLTGSFVNISSINNAPTSIQNTLMQSGSLRRSALFTINTAKPPALLLVANKSDLERFRLVQKAEAEEFAKSHGIPYFEITVTETYKEVQSVFHAAARLCLQSKGLKLRQVNGQPTSGGRGILPSGNPPSVLTSLAVSPSLLLQKKSTSSVPANPEATAGLETESNSGPGGPASLISNLRLRATSPTSAQCMTKPPSSAWYPTPQTTSASKQLQATQPPPSQKQLNTLTSVAAQPAYNTSPSNILSRKTQNLTNKSIQPQSEQRPSSSGLLSNVNQSARTPAAQPSRQPAPPPVSQPKKNSIGFKFFSKRK